MTTVAASELTEALQAGESETCEFRSSFGDEALRTLCAFANTRGGTLWVGVRDDGVVAGVVLGKETLRDWANQIRQTLGVNATLDALEVDGKTVVRIAVAESNAKPVRFKGRSWKRAGSTDQHASDEDETRWVLERVGQTWDALPEPRARWEDLSPEQMARFRRLCNQQGRRLIPDSEDDATVLHKLELITPDGQITRAAVLLFGQEPQRFYHTALVRIGRFQDERLIHVLDDYPVYGTLWDQVEGAMAYLRQHMQMRYGPTPEPARQVVWEYPLEALREAIINAVCHRDYLIHSQTQIRWFPDSLVIVNPGELMPPLTLESLKQTHPSRLRNPLIAEMFYYAGWIEQWGSGIHKILTECAQAGLPEPQFRCDGWLWLTFRKDIFTEEYLQSLGLNERQIRAVAWAKEKGGITNAEYQSLASVSARTASRELAVLVQRGVLEQVGKTGRGTRYVIKTPKTP